MNNDLISIIVPVYNVEKYLPQCIESILQQTYNNIEIILVNDGSTDNSGKICDNYTSHDSRIKVFHKNNGGLSDARNFGISHASGKYISFIDSDDFVENDFIEFLYRNLLEHDVKISACGLCNYYVRGGGTKQEIVFRGIKRKYMHEDAQKYLNKPGYFDRFACNKLYYKTLFDDIKFPFGKKYEDVFIMYKLLDLSGGIYYSSDVKYYYRKHQESITRTSIPFDLIEGQKEAYQFYVSRGMKKVLPYAAQSIALAYMNTCTRLFMHKNREGLIKFHEEAIELRNKFTYDGLAFKKKLQLFLFLNVPGIYYKLFSVFDKFRTLKNFGFQRE